MKTRIILGLFLLISASDLVFGRPAERQKRWDIFSRANEWLNNFRGRLRVDTDDVADIAEAVVARTSEHLHNAADHLETFGTNVRDRLHEARGRLESYGRNAYDNSRGELVHTADSIAEAFDGLAERINEDDLTKPDRDTPQKRIILE